MVGISLTGLQNLFQAINTPELVLTLNKNCRDQKDDDKCNTSHVVDHGMLFKKFIQIANLYCRNNQLWVPLDQNHFAYTSEYACQ